MHFVDAARTLHNSQYAGLWSWQVCTRRLTWLASTVAKLYHAEGYMQTIESFYFL
jgi:hypothetical protein